MSLIDLKPFIKIIPQRKALCRQTIPDSTGARDGAREETVDMDILMTSRNGNRKMT